MVFRTLARMTGERDVEDLAQEVFLRLFRALPGFRGEAKVTTFIYRIIINVVKDEWGRRERARLTVRVEDCDLRSNAPGPGETLDHERFLHSLNDCMHELSVPERAVLTLHFQEERTYEEIASVLDLPLGTVKTHLHRARQKLKMAMKERMTPCRTAT